MSFLLGTGRFTLYPPQTPPSRIHLVKPSARGTEDIITTGFNRWEYAVNLSTSAVKTDDIKLLSYSYLKSGDRLISKK